MCFPSPANSSGRRTTAPLAVGGIAPTSNKFDGQLPAENARACPAADGQIWIIITALVLGIVRSRAPVAGARDAQVAIMMRCRLVSSRSFRAFSMESVSLVAGAVNSRRSALQMAAVQKTTRVQLAPVARSSVDRARDAVPTVRTRSSCTSPNDSCWRWPVKVGPKSRAPTANPELQNSPVGFDGRAKLWRPSPESRREICA